MSHIGDNKNFITIDIGNTLANGVTSYVNVGAGYEVSFSPGENDEVLVNLCLLTKNYKGEDLLFSWCGALYDLAPGPTSKIQIEVDYYFYKEGSGDNPYIESDGTVTQVFDVSGWSEDSAEQHMFDPANKLLGKTGATHLQLTIRRQGTGTTQDNYGETVDVYQMGLQVLKP